MLTTKYIFQHTDDIHNAWAIAMKDDSMTKEQIMETNISKVVNEIIEQKDTIVFHLSGILLRGVVKIYSKKANYVLCDCKDILEKISLRYHQKEQQKQNEPTEEKTKTNNIEVDNETLELWKREVNLETVINEEKEENINFVNVELETPNKITNEIEEIRPFENDLGDVPIELSIINDIYTNEVTSDNDGNDGEIPNVQNVFVANEESKTKTKFKIDVTPIIPMSELSLILENTKSTLCKRPITKREDKTLKNSIVNNELNELFIEAKKRFRNYMMMSQEHVELPEIQENPPIPSENYEEAPQYITSDSTSICDEMENPLIPEIEKILSDTKLNRVNFLDIVEGDKRSIANSFYQILALKNQGKIELSQETSEKNLWVEKI